MDNTINNEQIVSNKAKFTLSIQNLVLFTRRAYKEKVPSHMLWKVFVERLLVPDGQTLEEFLEEQKNNSKRFNYTITPQHYDNPNFVGKYLKNVRMFTLHAMYPRLILIDKDMDFNISGFKDVYTFIYKNIDEILSLLGKINIDVTEQVKLRDYFNKGFNSIYGLCRNENSSLYFTHSFKEEEESIVSDFIKKDFLEICPEDFVAMDVDTYYLTSKANMDTVKHILRHHTYKIKYGLDFINLGNKRHIVMDGKTIIRNYN